MNSSTTGFASIGISDLYIRRLKQEGILAPTPVQEAAIPILLSGRDLIAQAQTGTGKTLAFALPLLEAFDPQAAVVQGLIVAPTRELALQITAELRKLAPLAGANVLAVYGGQDVEAQIRKLKSNPAIVVCTPGRLLDHLKRGTIDLSNVRKLVLDEADQMLHMGFLADVEAIIRELPADRQTMLFSATMPEAVKRLAHSYMNRPADVRIQGKQVTLEEIRQFVVETTDRAKQAALFRLLELYQPFLAVIFCRTKIRAKKLTEAMHEHGFNVDELHGDLTQSKREQVMERFRKADLQYLVATDVAARGLDVEGVTHVFNYDIPLDPEWYIHRIGRTGRAKQKGTAVTLVAPKDRALLARIEQGIGSALKRRTMEEFNIDPSGETHGAEESRGNRSKGLRQGSPEERKRQATGKERSGGYRDRDRGAAYGKSTGGRKEFKPARAGKSGGDNSQSRPGRTGKAAARNGDSRSARPGGTSRGKPSAKSAGPNGGGRQRSRY